MPVPSIAQDIPLDMAGSTGGPTAPATPPLGFFDQLRLGWKADQARPSWGFNETNWKNSAISEVEDALRKKGVEPAVDLMNSDDWMRKSPIRPGEDYAKWENRVYSQVFAQVAQVQQSDASFLPGYQGVIDKGSFDQLVTNRQKAQLQSVQAQAPDGLGWGGTFGGLAHGQLDPVNYIPILGETGQGLSFGKRLLQQGLRFGAFNMGVTAATEPMVRENARKLGIDRTNGDFISDLLTSGASGAFVMNPLVEGVRFAGSRALQAFRGPKVAAEAAPAPGAAPEAAAEPTPAPKTGTPFDSFDARVAKTFADIVPPEERTPDEQAAIHAINRDTEIKATSPFVEGPAGDDAHYNSLDAGMRAATGEPPAPRAAVKPVTRETVQTAADVEGTRMPARELVKAKIHSVEGDGPNRLGGRALGPYQFEPTTWVNLFKRRYPGDQRSFDQIAALREDPHLNDVLMNDLLSENSAALRHAGFDETAGNLYLAHVLGHDRAVTVLRAGTDAKLGDLLPHNYFAKNPFKPTDSAASLIHWVYRKMGDDGSIPAHIAATPDAGEGSQAIAEAENLPEVQQPSPGQFDVEALYGDVGMADRPVLKPELFGSPEEHAAAQLRFERESDAADGFAPVMSRAEAFAPTEHFDALRRYKGSVTADAIGEALGLTPDEVRRAVGSMQSADANSPFMLSRGRQPKFDVDGNVVRAGTEPGRVIRRPPKPGTGKVETMLEYLTRTGGGLKDDGGDLAAMGAADWHRQGPFRRKLVDNEHGQTLDDAYQRAIDAGYFPEHAAGAETYAQLPDIADFHQAVDAELRGRPRYATTDYAAAEDAARQARYAPEEEHQAAPESAADRAERLFERTGHNQEAISEAAAHYGITLRDDDMVIDASDLIDAGLSPDEAIERAALASAYRTLDEAMSETGNSTYAIDPEERFAGYEPVIEEGDFEPRDLAAHDGERGSGAADQAEAASRSRLEELAHDPAAAKFGDPVGLAADAQADSLIHDLQMQPDEGGAYRLDDDSGEHSIKSLLDDVDEEQRAADEMRNCLKPNGGEE